MRSDNDSATPCERARDFTSQLATLLRRERDAAAEFVCALAEFDRSKLWQELGYASLFDFLHRELRMSAGAAHYRKVAVELVQRFPECTEPLRDGRLCITAVPALARVITPENAREVLPRFFHLSRREAQCEAAAISPAARPPERDVVTPLRLTKASTAVVYLGSPGLPRLASAPSSAAATDHVDATPTQPSTSVSALDVETSHSAALSRSPEVEACSAPAERTSTAPGPSPGPPDDGAPAPTAPPRRNDTAEPLDGDLSRLHVTVNREFLQKLEAARDALSHARPGASMAEILEAGLDLVLARRDRRRGVVDRPRPERAERDAATTENPTTTGGPTNGENATEPHPGYIPAAVKRAAWKRAGGRCEWPLDGGGACGSTVRLEFDHIVPRARGGPSTLENIRVLCRDHNVIAARQCFGDEWMDQFTRERVTRPDTG